MRLNESRLVRASVFWWIGLLCLFGLVSVPGILQTNHLVLFILLFGLHIALHWVMLYWPVPPSWRLGYFAVQSLLVFGIGFTTPYVSLPLGLFAILLGQATGYGLTRPQLGALISVYTILMALLFGVTDGLEQTTLAPFAAVVFLLMVVAVVALYRRLVHARDQAESVVVELKQAHEQLRTYAEQVEDLTLMAERQRMARELHDTLAQGLAGLILQLEAVEAHLGNGRITRAQEIVQQAMGRARTALADSRRTIDNLRGDWLASDDFEAALAAEVERFTAATALACHLDLGELPPLSKSVQEHALRAVAEGLTNVARHARATHVWIRVAQEDNALTLDIRDDGVGFDSTAVGQQRGHYGLVGMNERAELTGGVLTITSAPGAGTSVRLRLPLAMEGAI